MNETETYITRLQRRWDAIIDIAASMTNDELNRAPAISEGNSVYALVAHTAGNARAWLLGIAAGQPLRRDRPAEFASSGTSAELVALLRETFDEGTAALRALGDGRLDERLMPSAELWGNDTAREISRRDAVLQVLEHASLHLGHIELTRDIIRAGGAAGGAAGG